MARAEFRSKMSLGKLGNDKFYALSETHSKIILRNHTRPMDEEEWLLLLLPFSET
jgi:hypothetical protein